MNTPMRTPFVSPMSRRELFGASPFGSLFDDFLSDVWARPLVPAFKLGNEMPAIARARMDVIDKGNAYAITIDLPGVRKEDINVSVEGPRVAISAETVTETPVKEGEKLLHTERYAASYARTFELPSEVIETGADAAFENGVLTLTLPKREVVASKRLPIH